MFDKFLKNIFSPKPYTYRARRYRPSKGDYAWWVSIGANLVTIVLFVIFIAERRQQQSIQAWEIVSSEGGANLGKSLALQTLFGNGENLQELNLGCKEVKEEVCASRSIIRDVDLSPRLKLVPFDISYADLEGLPFHEMWLPALTVSADENDVHSWFRRFDARGATFTGARFENVDLRGANLGQASFSQSIIKNVKFDYAAMRSTLFNGASLYNNSFHRAAIDTALFENATLRENDFSLASLRFSRFYYSAVCTNNFTLSDLSFVRAFTTATLAYNFYAFGEPPVIGNTKKLLELKIRADAVKDHGSDDPALQLAIKDNEGLAEYLLAPRQFDFIAINPNDEQLASKAVYPSDFEDIYKAEARNDELASMTLPAFLQWLSGSTYFFRYVTSLTPQYPQEGCQAPIMVLPYDNEKVVSFEDQRKARSSIAKQ